MTTPRMLRLPAVIAMAGIGRDTIYKLVRNGEFPRPRKLTDHCTGWREDEIREWIESRPVSDLRSPNPKSAAQ